MKKSLSLMMVLMMMVLLLAGCNNASGVTTVPATQPSKPVATTPVVTTPVATAPVVTTPVVTTPALTAPTTTPAPTTPPTTPAPTEPTTAEPEDPLALFRTTFEMAEQKNGLFLLRDDKVYVMKFYWEDNSIVDYPAASRLRGGVQFYTVEQEYYRDKNSMFKSLGDVPVPVISRQDRLIAFFSRDIELKYRLSPVVHCGYSFPIERGGLGEHYIIDKNGIEVTIPKNTPFEITDANGKSVDDYWNLEKGMEYTIFWYEGSRYNETKIVADCNVYQFDESQVIIKEMNRTKNGYFELDLSGVPNGLYFSPTWPSIVFEISN